MSDEEEGQNLFLITYHSPFLQIYSAELRRRGVRAEVLGEAFGVRVEKPAHAREVGRAHDETDVVGLLHAEDYLRVVVTGRVRMLLARERERDAAVLAPRSDRADPLAARVRYLDARPLAPEVAAARRLQGLRDVRAADARRDFEEVELAVRRAAYELCVRRAALHAERAQKLFVQARQLGVLGRVVIQSVRREDSALVRDAHRRPPVAARAVEDYAAVFDHGVDVE